MKKYILALSAIVLLAALIFIIGCTRNSQNADQSSGIAKSGKQTTGQTSSELTINDIYADPFGYKGTITVTGVVANPPGDIKSQLPASSFSIIDTSEAKTCKQTGCARFYLPVKYDGQPPTEWDEVNVTGSISGSRYPVFTATKVDVIRHLEL